MRRILLSTAVLLGVVVAGAAVVAGDTPTAENATANETPQDLDGDGLSDAVERETHGTNPDAADTDGDGVEDAREVSLGLDPTIADTDDDGVHDGKEIEQGSDPRDSGDSSPTPTPELTGTATGPGFTPMTAVTAAVVLLGALIAGRRRD